MISSAPSKVRKPGTPQQFKTLLIAFTIRQILSVIVLGYLLMQSFRAGGSFWIFLSIISVAFIVFAVRGWLRIRGQYLRTLRQAAVSGVRS